MSKSNELRILSWNADGLRTKINELLDLVAFGELSIDLIAICETRLTDNITLSTPGYACYRQDKKDGVGQGVALLVKSDIGHTRISVPKTKNLEAIGIQVSISGKTYKIYSVYQSPNLPFDTDDLGVLFKTGRHVLVMGDLNAKNTDWNCPATNARGRSLVAHMLKNDYIIHAPTTPTLVHYHSNHTPSTPDLALSQNIKDISKLRTIPSLSSNHLPFTFTITGSFRRKTLKFFRYSDADWVNFRAMIDKDIHLSTETYRSSAEIDLAIDHFTKTLVSARSKSVPQGTMSSKPPPLPRKLRRLIKLKNRIRRIEQHDSCALTRRWAKSSVNHLQHEIQHGIKDHNSKTWEKKLAKVDHPSSDLWRLAKSLRCKPTIIPPLKLSANDITLTTSVGEQCEVLADAFQENMRLTLNWQCSDDLQKEVDSSLKTIDRFNEIPSFRPIRPKEIWKCLRNLKRRKATGEDSLHNAMLKNLSQKAVVFLTKVFNGCLSISYFPSLWKTAKVVALLKTGKDDTLGTSYRPISLLSSLSKILESLVYARLLAATSHALKNEQFGFRRHHSTTQQLARVAEHVTYRLNLGESTGMFLLDLEKAFDTVWHDGLLHKLVTLKVPLALVKLIKDYLNERRFFVSISEEYRSLSRLIPAGVPQGSILGPYLFLLYLNDVPIQTRTSLACFADDTASFTSSNDTDLIIDRLQLSIQLLQSYFTKWKLKLNDTKTEAIMFSKKRKVPSRSLQINDHKIPWANSVRYLGVHLDRRMNWSHHTTQLRLKGIKALGALGPILNKRSNLRSTTKLQIYSTLVRPCITYAAPVWSSTCKTNFYKLQVVQNRALRTSYNTPLYTNLQSLHEQIIYPTITDFIHGLTRKFYLHSVKQNPNSLVSSIGRTRKANLPFIDKYKTYRLPHHLILGDGKR